MQIDHVLSEKWTVVDCNKYGSHVFQTKKMLKLQKWKIYWLNMGKFSIFKALFLLIFICLILFFLLSYCLYVSVCEYACQSRFSWGSGKACGASVTSNWELPDTTVVDWTWDLCKNSTSSFPRSHLASLGGFSRKTCYEKKLYKKCEARRKQKQQTRESG